MDRREVSRALGFHMNRLRDFMGLNDFKIDYVVGHIVGDIAMSTDSSLISYKHFTITIDFDCHDHEDHFLDNLFHELCHVLHADFTVYRKMVEAINQSITPQVAAVEQHAWTHAAEGFVLRMEWLWRNQLRDLYLDQVTRPETAPTFAPPPPAAEASESTEDEPKGRLVRALIERLGGTDAPVDIPEKG